MKASILLLFIFLTGLGFAQTQKSKKEIRGDKLYFIFGYHEAIKKYEKAIKKDSLSTDGYRNLANSYLKTADYQKAEGKFAELINRKDKTAEDLFSYANILKMNGKYKESELWMNKYFELAPDEIRSKNNRLLIDKVEGLKKDQGYFELKELPINSNGQEFSPAFYGDQIVYSANAIQKEQMFIKNFIWDNISFLDLFIYDPLVEDSSFQKKEFYPRLNKKYHEGVATFSSDLTKMYYTANNYEKRDSLGSHNLEVYITEDKGTGEWSEPVSFEFNDPSYSVGHPYLTKDGKTLYFASNMPGGYGGTDLYKCTLTKEGIWSQPINLGTHINTEGDELFPFYHEDKNMLFFTSNGHYGLGGMDIFATTLGYDGKFGKINNFGTPLNSQYDDFGFIVDSKMKTGYFSSNRNTGKGNDDIYKVNILKDLKTEEFVLEKDIVGVVKNVEGKPVPNAKLELIDASGKLIKTVTTKTDGTFFLKALENQNYTIVTSKQYYNTDTTKISTVSEELAVKKDIQLTVKEEIVVVDNVMFLKVQTIYFDVNSAELRPDTKSKLANVIKIMNDNPTMEIELGSHTDCRGTRRHNNQLSQARATNTAEYIRQRIKNPQRIKGVGYGETQLVNNCPCEGKTESTCSDEEHQANRRTEFKIVNIKPETVPDEQ